MTVKERLLSYLEENRGSYVSGEMIAKQLLVSRAAVWKAVSKLKEEGFQIEAVTNKGYKLSEKTDILSVPGISKYLNDDAIRVEVFESVTSTNLALKERAYEAEGLVLAASKQTKGMGRLGRQFESPDETGLYFSILIKPKMNNEDIQLLTPMAAVAVCEAIERNSELAPQIKWVNDVFLGEKKVCGILTQASFNLENLEPEYVIVGIGINVYLPKNGFGKDVEKCATVLFDEPRDDMKNKLLADVVNIFFEYYNNFSNKKFIEKYKNRCFLLGRSVDVIIAGGSRKAIVRGLDDYCHLLVEYEDGSNEYLSSGEVSIRL